MEAIGIVELYGFVGAIKAADAAAKAADVKIIAIDSNKPANAEKEPVPLVDSRSIFTAPVRNGKNPSITLTIPFPIKWLH